MRKDRNMATISVLLVDDEAEFLEYLKSRLESRGLTVFSAASGLDALQTMGRHRIDVVVLDVRMPGIGGLEVLRKTKQKHPLAEVIMLSGHATVESAIDGLKLGAFDYVTKPCDISDLLEKINAAFARKEATEEKIRKAKVDKIIRHPLAVFDKEEWP
jgi:DNA-binding NtrC family response regulator